MKTIKHIVLFLGILISGISCSDETASSLRDDYIMKTIAPAMVGETLEFAYAMGALDGVLASVTAEVNIIGAPGTGFNPNSFHVDSRGNDIGVLVADTSTESNISRAVFSIDTTAATLRFNYVVPEEARGQSVYITFEAESTLGEKVSTTTPKYPVSKMDIKRGIVMTDNDVCFFSIETMKSYTAAEVEAQGLTDKIDLMYLYDALNSDGIIYGHALVSPGSDEKYLNSRIIPASFSLNKTRIQKQVFIRDMQLSGTIPANFVDDIDLETLDLSNSLDFILGISNTNSAFIETADGKYRAYLFFNEAKRRTLTFGIKRLEMQ
ncbi:MAG: DUF4466 family protein [Bacteroidales bacterium]|nr:DUF4466 family protein [Bacteroidales bacterium]MCF8391299.1 DUF4466 family protein [Bacteroidales bacterium]